MPQKLISPFSSKTSFIKSKSPLDTPPIEIIRSLFLQDKIADSISSFRSPTIFNKFTSPPDSLIAEEIIKEFES